MKEDEPFRVRAYHKGILAHLYNPGLPVESAMRKLRNWIRKNEDLYDALYSGREGKNDHYFTRRQVELIVDQFRRSITYATCHCVYLGSLGNKRYARNNRQSAGNHSRLLWIPQ